MKPSLLKKEEVYAYDVNEGCRASIRTGQECVNEKMGKKRSSEMDAKSVNTDPEMLAECCNPSEETSEKLIALSRQVSEDDDSELSAPTAVARASQNSDTLGVPFAMQRPALVIQTA